MIAAANPSEQRTRLYAAPLGVFADSASCPIPDVERLTPPRLVGLARLDGKHLVDIRNVHRHDLAYPEQAMAHKLHHR